MKKYLLYFLLISLSINVFGREFYNLEEALKEPEEVESLYLKKETKSSEQDELPKEFSKCKNLRKLYVGRGYNFKSKKLFESLAKLPNLDTLEIVTDSISVSQEIRLLTNLKSLNLDFLISYQDMEHISKLKNLEMLKIGCYTDSILPPSFEQLTKLRNLRLGGFKLTTIPLEVTNLTSLKELSFFFTLGDFKYVDYYSKRNKKTNES